MARAKSQVRVQHAVRCALWSKKPKPNNIDSEDAATRENLGDRVIELWKAGQPYVVIAAEVNLSIQETTMEGICQGTVSASAGRLCERTTTKERFP